MARHKQTHGQIFREFLKGYNKHDQALLAEATAITYLEKKKNEFGGFINASFCFENEALHQNSDLSGGGSSKGVAKKQARPTVAGPDQQRCSHCGRVTKT